MARTVLVTGAAVLRQPSDSQLGVRSAPARPSYGASTALGVQHWSFPTHRVVALHRSDGTGIGP